MLRYVRAMDLNAHYRFWLHTRRPYCASYTQGEEVPRDATCARLRREKSSHRGIGERTALRELATTVVNQDFLEEIGSLTSLEYLELGWPVTAIDLSPLTRLSHLQILKLDSPRNITDFTPLLKLPKLEHLFIENAKHMTDIEWVRPLKQQLKVFGIEGSMYTTQHIASLKPLEGFRLEALFLTNTQIRDQSLAPLRSIGSLKFLGTALNAPRAEFEALHSAQPQVKCDWFDPLMWVRFKDPKPPKS